MVPDPCRDVAGEGRGAAVRALLDTNVLVRHLTGDPPEQARRASAFLAGGHELILLDTIVAELVYVLDGYYGLPRREIATAVRSLLALPSVLTPDLGLLLRVVELFETLRLDFADAYLAAAGELWGIGRVASFDRRLDRVRGITRIEP